MESPALVGGVAVLERAVSYALGSLALVTPPLLARPTPCSRWLLRDLLAHLTDSMAALGSAPSGRVEPAVLTPAGDLAVAAREQAALLLGAWANINGDPAVRVEDADLSAPIVAGAGAIEVTVHGWDIARACDRPRPIPADLADELLDLAVLLVRPPDRPGRFAPPLSCAADAPPAERLLAFLGRRESP